MKFGPAGRGSSGSGVPRTPGIADEGLFRNASAARINGFAICSGVKAVVGAAPELFDAADSLSSDFAVPLLRSDFPSFFPDFLLISQMVGKGGKRKDRKILLVFKKKFSKQNDHHNSQLSVATNFQQKVCCKLCPFAHCDYSHRGDISRDTKQWYL
jgi:hypothetical protein